MNRRLYRCRHDRRVAGVASGIAEYFDVDPTLVRLLFVVSVFFGGLGLLLYVAMALIVPLEPEERFVPTSSTGDIASDPGVPAPSAPPARWQTAPAGHRHASGGPGRGTTFAGLVMILFGSLALIDTLLPAWADGGRFLWPAFVVGIGALLVASAVKREPTEP